MLHNHQCLELIDVCHNIALKKEDGEVGGREEGSLKLHTTVKIGTLLNIASEQ